MYFQASSVYLEPKQLIAHRKGHSMVLIPPFLPASERTMIPRCQNCAAQNHSAGIHFIVPTSLLLSLPVFSFFTTCHCWRHIVIQHQNSKSKAFPTEIIALTSAFYMQKAATRDPFPWRAKKQSLLLKPPDPEGQNEILSQFVGGICCEAGIRENLPASVFLYSAGFFFSHAAVVPRTLSTDRGREKCFRKGRLTPYVS